MKTLALPLGFLALRHPALHTLSLTRHRLHPLSLSRSEKLTIRTTSTMAEAVRLGAIVTPMGSSNEVVYVPPQPGLSPTPSPVLAFFGGDVQDYPEVMAAHRDNMLYVAWSLTATAVLLAAKFPTHHILVIKPSRMERETFSCYDNFVTSNSVGAPTHEPHIAAVNYLASLISETLKVAKVRCALEGDSPSGSTCQSDNIISQQSFQSCLKTAEASESQLISNSKQTTTTSTEVEYQNITLIGFSKGCVVLNQLITEFYTIATIKELGEKVPQSFINKVQDIYWIDGGHAGGHSTWITNPSILKSLAACHINIHIHVTPYQVLDEQRPWIGKECKTFYNTLRHAGAKVDYKLHFQNLPPTLFNHFKALNEFI